MYYRNDTNFFMKVIRKENGPHELCIKINPDHKRQGKEVSIDEVNSLLVQYGVEKPETSYMKNGTIKSTIFIDDTEKAVTTYRDLSKKLHHDIPGYYTKVFYQKDVEILEKYGDEEAAEYYKQEKEKPHKGNLETAQC